MIKFIFSSLFYVLLLSCSDQSSTVKQEEGLDTHDALVSEFQQCQKELVTIVSQIDSEQTFDASLDSWSQLNARFNQLTAKLKNAPAPTDEVAKIMREKIAKGNKMNAPTGEMMLTLLSIESREAEVTKVLKNFQVAASQAMQELHQLYDASF